MDHSYNKSTEQVLNSFNVDAKRGLTAHQAKSGLERFGRNGIQCLIK